MRDVARSRGLWLGRWVTNRCRLRPSHKGAAGATTTPSIPQFQKLSTALLPIFSSAMASRVLIVALALVLAGAR